MQKRHKTGVIIGRFQVPYLHLGHVYLIGQVEALCERTFILLGTSEEMDARNPLPYDIRQEMILDSFRNIFVFPMPDKPTNEEWSKGVDDYLEQFDDVMLFGSRDSFRGSYTGRFPYTELMEVPDISGSGIRNNLEPINNKDFRTGIIYASQLKNHKNGN